MKILMLPGSFNSPASRVRIWQFAEPLRKLGHEVEVRVIMPERHWKSSLPKGPGQVLHQAAGVFIRLASACWILRDAEKFDIIMMNKDIVPEVKIDFLEPAVAKKNPHLIFDFDDAIHLGMRGKKLQKILPVFSRIIAGNPTLAEYTRSVAGDKVSILPTVVDTDRLVPAVQRRPGPVRIGWSGSEFSAAQCLPLLEKAITRLAQEKEFEFILISNKPFALNWSSVRTRYVPWTAETEAEGLQQLDIGLMPLRDDPFERGKCGMKAIQYMAVGIPALVSPVGVNREIVVHGQTGYHCEDDDSWCTSLKKICSDFETMRRMGMAGRQRAVESYSLKFAVPRLLDIFEAVRARPLEKAHGHAA